MKDERAPLDPPDEEELRSAAALARALEGGADEPELPQSALETAALLRLSAGAAELAPERSKAIRNELLAGLPARSERRRRSALPGWARGLPRWLFVALPLGGTAALCLLLLVNNPERDASYAARSPAAASVPELAEKPTAVAGDDPASVARSSPIEARPREVPQSQRFDAPTEERRSARAELPFSEPEADIRAPGSYAVPAPEGSALRVAPADDGARGIGSVAGGGLRREAMAAKEAGAPSAASARAGRPAASPPVASPLAASAAPLASQPGARAALTGLDQQVRAERTQLLARSNDAELSRAHAELDGAGSRAELQRSQARLTRLLETAGQGLGADDARQVRQDLYCRLAETALRLGEPRAALEWTRQGIELDGPPSPFLAQLMALEGDALAALGEPSSAASSYMRALRVHEALLDESLDGQ